MVNQGTDTKYWDNVAGRMDGFYVDNPFFRYKKRELLKLIENWGKSKLGGAVLKTDLYEEALGYDDFLFDIAVKNEKTHGIDISSKMVRLAQDKAAKQKIRLHLSMQDVRRLQYQNDNFDLIISNSTIDHFPEIDQALGEFFRVAKKDGVLILTLHNRHNPMLNLMCRAMKILNHYHDFYTDNTYSIKDATARLEKAGFKVMDTTTIIHIFPVLPSLVNILYKSRFATIRKAGDKLVRFFEFIGNKETFLNNFMGYLIAVKAVKE